jgi:hypothetical protein
MLRQYLDVPLEFSDLNSVDEFLRRTDAARKSRLNVVENGLRAYMDDPSTIGVTPELGEIIEKLVESHGDEVYRQISIFCLGKWLDVHSEIAHEHFANQTLPELVATTSDAARLSTALQVMEQVGSFGGDQSWREMLCSKVADTVLADFEKRGIDPSSIFKNKS